MCTYLHIVDPYIKFQENREFSGKSLWENCQYFLIAVAFNQYHFIIPYFDLF